MNGTFFILLKAIRLPKRFETLITPYLQNESYNKSTYCGDLPSPFEL